MSIRRSNTGFTLIEVMIGIVVVAVGLLMVAGLQLVSKRSSYDAVQRSGASMLAHDLAARMRTNRAVIGTPATA